MRPRVRKNHLLLGVPLLLGMALAPGEVSAQTQASPKRPTRFSRVRLFVNFGFTPGTVDYSQTVTFQRYAEDGRVESDYSAGSGTGFEGGLHYRFNSRMGAMASFASTSRDSSLAYSATIPHPLYLDRDRSTSGTQDGLSWSETAIHLDFVYQVQAGGLDVFFFVGPSRLQVKTDLLSRLDIRDTYPYDEVAVNSVVLAESKASAWGANFGAGADYWFGKSKTFGLGAQVRYTTGSATLTPADGPTIDVSLGGFQVGGGLRLNF